MARVTCRPAWPSQVCAVFTSTPSTHQCRGVEPSPVVKTPTSAAGGTDGRVPDAAAPLGVAKRAAVVVRELVGPPVPECSNCAEPRDGGIFSDEGDVYLCPKCMALHAEYFRIKAEIDAV
jgi:hypothetical protein